LGRGIDLLKETHYLVIIRRYFIDEFDARNFHWTW